MNSLVSESNYQPYAGPDGFPESAAQESANSGPQSGPIDVFGYEEYRSFLRDRFAELQSRDPAFSQRGLARKAGIANPGFFNEVIKGRRRLSPAAAAKMSVGLDLAPQEADYFAMLVEYCETREPRAKLTVSRRLLALRNQKLARDLGELPQPPETMKDLVRELNQEWVLQAAGLDVKTQGGERASQAVPMSEGTLQTILDKLVAIRERADAGAEGKVVQVNLQVLPRDEAKKSRPES